MFGSAVLEVGIGIIFVFVLVSVICTAVREGLDAWMKTRAAFLHHAIRELLHDKTPNGLATNLFKHPLIYGLFSGGYTPPAATDPRPGAFTSGGNLPSYIPSRNFAVALLDLAAHGPQTGAASSSSAASVISLDTVRANIGKLGNNEVQRALLTAIDSAQGDLDTAIKNIETWFDSAMDRVSGWYRRSTQWVLLWVGLAVAVILNINTISVVHYLSQNEKARAVIVQQAEKAAADANTPKRSYEDIQRDLDKMRLPIGWPDGIVDSWGAPRRTTDPTELWNFWLGPLLGWLITALAATLGAPFWFDVLNKFMVIRSTVKPHEKSPEEGSEDRQTAADRRARTLRHDVAAGGAGAGAGASGTSAARVQTPDPADADTAIDACDVDLAAEPTPDDQLPAAKGGVAKK